MLLLLKRNSGARVQKYWLCQRALTQHKDTRARSGSLTILGQKPGSLDGYHLAMLNKCCRASTVLRKLHFNHIFQEKDLRLHVRLESYIVLAFFWSDSSWSAFSLIILKKKIRVRQSFPRFASPISSFPGVNIPRPCKKHMREATWFNTNGINSLKTFFLEFLDYPFFSSFHKLDDGRISRE